jgi:hypothetical protein
MIWIIVAAAVLVAVAVIITIQRRKVLESKQELEESIEGVINSFEDLTEKIKASELGEQEKKTLIGNIDRNIAQLERWRDSSLPNVTFWKNHTAPIEKEFNNLRESVATELSRYNVTADEA